jgi:hypothetical protein
MVVELPVKQMYNSSSHWALYSLKELKMAELKTKLNKASVDKFIKSIKDEQVRDDCFKIIDVMQKSKS